MLIEDKIEKLEKWVGDLSAENRRLQEQVATLTRERDAAIREMSEHARLLGLAEGKLEGWTARAKTAEVELDRLRAALRLIAGLDPCVDNLMGNVDIALAALQKEPQP